MSLATKVYAAFREDEEKAQVLSEVFDIMEQRLEDYSSLARSDELKESHLRLQLEIEKNRTEIEKVRRDLKLDIEQVRSDLQIEIEKNRTEIEKVRRDLKLDIEQVRSDLQIEIEKTRTEFARLLNRQLFWILTAMSVMVGLIKGLDYLAKFLKL